MIPFIRQFLHRWWLRFQLIGLTVWQFTRLRFARALNSIYFGAFALGALTILGVLLGYIGYKCEAEWLIGVGQFAIAVGGMIASVVLLLLYFKVGVIGTHSLHAFDGFLEFVTAGKIKNFFSKEVAVNIRNDLLNAFAWVAAFCLWCDIVPVWKVPTAIPIGATLAAFFAFASSKLWELTQKRIGKAVVFGFIALAFVFHSFNVCTGTAISRWSNANYEVIAARFDSARSIDDGRRSIIEARTSFEEGRTKVTLGKYRWLASRQLELLEKGRGMTVDERSEFKRNERMMRAFEGVAPAKRQARENETTSVSATSNVLNVNRAASWIGSNFGTILIYVFVVFLLVMLIVGLATKQAWLAGVALGALLLIGLSGMGYWAFSRVGIGRAEVAIRASRPVAPLVGGQTTVLPPIQRQKRTAIRPIGLRRGLDAIVPEAPGEWP